MRVDLDVDGTPALVTMTRTEWAGLHLREGDAAWIRQVEGAPTVVIGPPPG